MWRKMICIRDDFYKQGGDHCGTTQTSSKPKVGEIVHCKGGIEQFPDHYLVLEYPKDEWGDNTCWQKICFAPVEDKGDLLVEDVLGSEKPFFISEQICYAENVDCPLCGSNNVNTHEEYRTLRYCRSCGHHWSQYS